MRKIHHLMVALLSLCAILASCSQDEKTVDARHYGQYQVTIISNSLTRGITDVVQGAGRYPEGETVTLFTNTQKFKASAKGSTDGDWNQVKEDVRAVLTSRINQDWTVTIKYYCDVTFINTAPGGDGTTKTVSLEVGTPLPTPVTNSGYSFLGWYDGETKVDKVPDSSGRTMVAKFKSALRSFIAVGDDGHIMYYNNGKATVVQVGSTIWYSITYGIGKYVAVGENGMIAYSIDGRNWNETTAGTLALNGVTYANNKFVSVGWTKLAYSYDGVNWSNTNIGSNTYNALNSVTYGNGKFVAVGSNSVYSKKSFAYSADGVNWNEVNLSALMYSVAFGNGRFVSVGNSYCFYSTNGIDWNKVNLIGSYRSIIYGNGKFVAVGDNGRVTYSSDGINWFPKTLMGGWKNWCFYAVTYTGDQFVAIGSEGNIAYSSDGINWDTIENGINTNYRGIFAVQ